MKAKKFEKKLELNKKTIADLSNREMGEVQGGLASGFTCPNCPPPLTVSRCETVCGGPYC